MEKLFFSYLKESVNECSNRYDQSDCKDEYWRGRRDSSIVLMNLYELIMCPDLSNTCYSNNERGK